MDPHINKSIPIPTLISSQVRSPYWNQVNIDHPHENEVKVDADTKIKWFPARIQKSSQLRPPTQRPSPSTSTLETGQFRSPHKIRVNFVLIAEIKSISISTSISSQFQCPATKNEVLSIQTLNTKHFRPPHKKKHINSDPYTEIIQFHLQAEIKSSSISYAEPKSISTTQTKSNSISILTPTQVISGPHTKTKSISTSYTKTKSIYLPSQYISTLKTCKFRPAHNDQVNFDPYIKTKQFSRTKTCQFPYPH